MSNTNLHNAKKAKNDEFYTQLEDIEKELSHYTSHFKDKVVYCNCDDPIWSNFWNYFHLNFTSLGLKKLISTHYNPEGSSYIKIYTGGADDDVSVGTITPLNSDGDFRNQECLDLLDEADIVVTNPPFSLFREYVAVLMEHEKKFLIIGNKNSITYKDFFTLLKNDEVWIGVTPMSQDMSFIIPKSMESDLLSKSKNGSAYRIIDGQMYARSASIWFTNLDHKKRHEKLIICKNYTPGEYLKYDNYDAINVDNCKNIPVDYDGIMGVPITFLDKYNLDQFEILGISASWDETDIMKHIKLSETHRHEPIINGKRIYRLIFIRKK